MLRLNDMQPTAQPSSRRTLGTDEIRLLMYDEEQSQRLGLLACQTRIQRLYCVNTGAAVPYAALSYVWGDAAITKPLICDAVEVQVTLNLHYALSVIWNAYPGIYLWADALSITQDNLTERNQQVSRMGEIYRSAVRVLVSLGPPLRGDNRFWELLQGFASYEQEDMEEYVDQVGQLMEGQPNGLTMGLHDLIDCDWFQRAWVRETFPTTAPKSRISCSSRHTEL